MKILAIDDEYLALKLLVTAISEVQPDAEIYPFKKTSELLSFSKEAACDVAFLDIEMRAMTGIQLAKALKDQNPKINIIFVTGYSEYAGQAFNVRASGYILKPVTKEAVERELEDLRYPINIKIETGVYVQTFGNFEVFVNGKPLAFSLAKAKELFAYLIDRDGACVKTSEIAAVLWEDKKYDRYMQNQTQKVISSMMQTLREAGIPDIIIRTKRNQRSVDKTKIECDYYRMLSGDSRAWNAYRGEYMSNYSWAEMTAGAISQKQQ